MKSMAGWNTPNTGATNSSGFSGLPGGYRDVDGSFHQVTYSGDWWCASVSTPYFKQFYLEHNHF
jgi:hypothetical protein